MTSAAFLQVWVQSSSSSHPLHDKVQITYIDQKIPSSPFLPYFEKFIDKYEKETVSILLNPETYKPQVDLGEVDITGNRCNSYIKFLFLSQDLRVLYCHISLDKVLHYYPSYILESESFQLVADYLRKLQKNNGLLQQSTSFQRKTVLCYRGSRPKAKLLCLPVLDDDPEELLQLFSNY